MTLALVLMTGSAQAALTENVINHIPGHYATLILGGADPEAGLDPEAITAVARAWQEKLGLEQLQFLVYARDTAPGQGAVAIGEILASDPDDPWFRPVTVPIYQQFAEHYVGYQVTPAKLLELYADNESVADAITGKPVYMHETIPQILKDDAGKAWIDFQAGDQGQSVRLYLDTNDPFLQTIGKDSEVEIKACPRAFTMNTVILEGYIIADGESVLYNGGLFTPDVSGNGEEAEAAD